MKTYKPSWYIYTPKGHFKPHIKVAFLREVELLNKTANLLHEDKAYKAVYLKDIAIYPCTALVSFQQWKDGTNWAIIKEL